VFKTWHGTPSIPCQIRSNDPLITLPCLCRFVAVYTFCWLVLSSGRFSRGEVLVHGIPYFSLFGPHRSAGHFRHALIFRGSLLPAHSDDCNISVVFPCGFLCHVPTCCDYDPGTLPFLPYRPALGWLSLIPLCPSVSSQPLLPRRLNSLRDRPVSACLFFPPFSIVLMSPSLLGASSNSLVFQG